MHITGGLDAWGVERMEAGKEEKHGGAAGHRIAWMENGWNGMQRDISK